MSGHRLRRSTYVSTLRVGVVEVGAVQELDAFAQGRGGASGGDAGDVGGPRARSAAGVGDGGGGVLPDAARGRGRGARARGVRRVSVFVLHLHGDVHDVGADAARTGRGREVRAGACAPVPEFD